MTAPSRPSRHVGAVLAGGLSRRMGSPKEGIRLPGGATMIESVLRAFRGCCESVVVVGACRGFDLSGCPGMIHLPDLNPGLGPLSGLEALLSSDLAEGYLVAACDQPALTVSALAPLLSDGPGTFYAPGPGEGLQPLPGYYPAHWLPRVRAAIAAGRLSLRRLVMDAPVRFVGRPPEVGPLLLNLNTPADLERFSRGAP